MPSPGPWARLAALASKALSAPEDLTPCLLGSDTSFVYCVSKG